MCMVTGSTFTAHCSSDYNKFYTRKILHSASLVMLRKKAKINLVKPFSSP